MAAEAIHQASPRKQGPFVIVDCGAIPPELLASELFGHERGAFTGAESARVGAFEEANGGTIFLDESGELPTELQPNLLRVLERREIKRVGRNKYQPIDVRVIAATNRSLRAEVNAHRFRSDLYYRLAVVEVRLPPLRERVEDLPLLADHIFDSLQADAQMFRNAGFLGELARHEWPGNVRELRNYLERCVALQTPTPIGEAPRDESAVDVSVPLKQVKDAFEKSYLEEIVRAHEGNVSAAARAAEVDRIQCYRLLWKHGLK